MKSINFRFFGNFHSCKEIELNSFLNNKPAVSLLHVFFFVPICSPLHSISNCLFAKPVVKVFAANYVNSEIQIDLLSFFSLFLSLFLLIC